MNDTKIEELKLKRDVAMQVAVEVVDTILGLRFTPEFPCRDLMRHAIDLAKAAKENLEQGLREAEAEWEARNREFNYEDMAVEDRIAERMGL